MSDETTTPTPDDPTPTPSNETQPAAPAQPPTRLYRRSDDKMLAGVLSGLAAHTGTDPVLWRIGAVVLCFATAGTAILAYIIAWLVIPEAPVGEPPPPPPTDPNRTRRWIGVGALALGAVVLFQDFWNIRGSIFWGLPFVGIGVALWGREITGTSDRPASPPLPPAPPSRPVGSGSTPPPPPSAPVVPTPPTPPVRRTPSILGRLVVGAALLAIGLAVLGDTIGAFRLTAQGAVTTLLLIVGIGLLVGSFYGRARWLIFPGLVLVCALFVTAFVPANLRGGYGEITWEPANSRAVSPTYEHAAGAAVLDLTGIDLRGRSVDIKVRFGFGELLVVTPPDVAVDVDAHVQGGELDLFGEISSGWDVGATAGVDGRLGHIDLDIDMGFGETRVQQLHEGTRVPLPGRGSRLIPAPPAGPGLAPFTPQPTPFAPQPSPTPFEPSTTSTAEEA